MERASALATFALLLGTHPGHQDSPQCVVVAVLAVRFFCLPYGIAPKIDSTFSVWIVLR